MVSISRRLQGFVSIRLQSVIYILLVYDWQIVDALKCFSGDPAFRNECTSLSYCLFIISRNGRTQHSCDGNPINQVSLCSTLGLQHDLAEEANFPTFVDRHRGDYRGQSDPKLVRTPYESSAISSNRYYPSRSLGGGSSHESSFGSSRRYGATPLTSGLRCFNGGELGRICCCTTDFCNFSVNHFCTKTVAAAMLFLLWRYFQRLF